MRRLSPDRRQSEVARQSDISTVHLNLIEHGRRPVGDALPSRLAKALEIESKRRDRFHAYPDAASQYLSRTARSLLAYLDGFESETVPKSPGKRPRPERSRPARPDPIAGTGFGCGPDRGGNAGP
jgi:transcriptional regulator with XRE-family HTH domain